MDETNNYYSKEIHSDIIDDDKFNKERVILCHHCTQLFTTKILKKEIECPKCNESNLVELTPFSEHQNSQFLKIICPFCDHKMTTKKESVYIICSICKKTILISKFFPNRKSDIMDIHYYHYNLVNTLPFNPYLRDPSDPLYLPKDYESSIYDDYENKKMLVKSVKPKLEKNDVYKPLFDTLNEITNNFNKKMKINYKDSNKLLENKYINKYKDFSK